MGDIAPKSLIRFRSVEDGQVLSYLTPKEAYTRSQLEIEEVTEKPRVATRSSRGKVIIGPSTTTAHTSTKLKYPEQNLPPVYKTLVQCLLVILALVILLVLINIIYQVIVLTSAPPPCVVPLSDIHRMCP